jgi:hypothetical protein
MLSSYLQNCGDTIDQKRLFWKNLCGWLPESVGPEVFAENGLSFRGNERSLYYKSYLELRKDKRTEHLEDGQLNERLGRLVLKALEEKEQLKEQAVLNNHVKELLDEIIKPEEEYHVMFKVINLKAKVAETKFWDCLIATYNREQLIEWGLDAKKGHPVGVDTFEEQTVIVMSGIGTNVTEVVKRARVDATRKLRILQNYLKEEFIHDKQLFFQLSTEYAVKKLTTGKIGWGLDHKNSPIEYDYSDSLVERVAVANEEFRRMKKCPLNIQELIERTLHWIGLSISEIEDDIKISYLCTALETLLTTKDDALKGGRIAYRGYLLGQEVASEDYYMPQRVLRVYELRSTIVHGSDIGIATEKDYWLMLDYTQATLQNFIQFVTEHKLTKPTKIFAKLLQSRHVSLLLEWLDQEFEDKYSEMIAESLRKDLVPKADRNK